jgi:hypothetical protein
MLVLLQAHGLTAGAICMIQKMFLLVVVPTIVVYGVLVYSQMEYGHTGAFEALMRALPFKSGV